MFDDFTQALIATLQRITELRYVPALTVAAGGAPGSADVWLSPIDAEVSDDSQIVVPVLRPEADQSTANDYRPLIRIPLLLRLSLRLVVATPGDGSYDPTMVALACVHSLSYTDGALADFMALEHPLSAPGGSPANPTAFEWLRYMLDTINVVDFGPGQTGASVDIEVQVAGKVWLLPSSEPAPTPIDEVRAPEPVESGGLGQAVRVVTDGSV